MQIRKAALTDIDLLIRLRIDFLGELHPLSPGESETISASLRDYFGRHIPAGTCMAMLAFDGEEPVSTAYLGICEKPANRSFVNGVTATLLNVWTHPNYRRQGIATGLIRALIEDARQAGVSSIDLSATEAGRPVYEKLGFEPDPFYTEMRLILMGDAG